MRRQLSPTSLRCAGVVAAVVLFSAVPANAASRSVAAAPAAAADRVLRPAPATRGVPARSATPTADPAATVPGAVVGAYAGAGNASGVDAAGAVAGHHLTYAMDFLDGTSWSSISDPTWFVSKWKGRGYDMIWGVPMLPNSGASLAKGATGAYDGYFKTLAANLVAQGQGSSVLRIGWEFNGGWFPWAANHHAADFVAYWKQIVQTMRSVKGAHFRFEWNPTRGDLGVGQLSEYYPGNAYVDFIGLDVYDVEWASYPGPQAEWQHMLTQTYGLDWLASFAKQEGKAIVLPEWGLGWTSGGSVGGGDNPYFVEHMAAWISANHVANAVVWDYGSNPLPSSSAPNSEAAFATAFKG
jgi:hypothetical protein